jgi:hypothetical protein
MTLSAPALLTGAHEIKRFTCGIDTLDTGRPESVFVDKQFAVDQAESGKKRLKLEVNKLESQF